MLARTAVFAIAAVTFVGSTAFAGSNFKFKSNKDHGPSFQFKQDHKPFQFDFGKSFSFGKQSQNDDCYELPGIHNLDLGKLFNKKKDDHKFDGLKDLICKVSGWKEKFNDCKLPKLPWDCDTWQDECDEPRDCDDKPGDNECPVVPVPAAGWAGLSMLGGLALCRKIRKGKHTDATA